MPLNIAIEQLLRQLRFGASAISLLFIFSSILVHNALNSIGKVAPPRSSAIIDISIRCIFVYLASQAVILLLYRPQIVQFQDRIIYTGICSMAWGSLCVRRHILLPEVIGFCVNSLVFGIPLLVIEALSPVLSTARHALSLTEFLQAAHVGGLLGYSLLLYLRQSAASGDIIEEEGRRLLSDSDIFPSSGQYPDNSSDLDSNSGSESDNSGDEDDGDRDKNTRTGRLRKKGDWMDYLSSFKVFVPFLIPRRDLKVQTCFLVCTLCLIADRALNVAVPTQLGRITDNLVGQRLVLSDLGIFFAVNILHGQSGLSMFMELAKIPIEQFSYRQLTNAAFSHVLELSMEFHSMQDSAEVMMAIEQGSALTNVLEVIFLEAAPAIIDLFVAFFLLYFKFGSLAALCMLTATLTFLALQVFASSWNVQNRRQLTKAERDEARVMHQAIQGWLTVSSFNMFAYEKYRFSQAVDKHMTAKQRWTCRDVYLTALMEACFPAAFVVLAYLVAIEIRHGRASPGDFVFLIQYWDYLIFPIEYLSKDYRSLVSDLVDAERLLDLLTTKPTVTDKPSAFDLGPVEGYLEFDKVSFSYDNREPAVCDINLSAAPGDVIALVGTTGAGKSTLVKLLLRYYDVTSGCIKIDGHDIRDITQSSLRGTLGIVSQNPILFNASIMENLRYAKLDATDEEIHEACRAAAIHDRISSFPDGYLTKVGEQGVKLSGGEIQRLAIARAFLKNPSVLILDEATSAVDVETEAKIQDALRCLIKGRTTLVIAHRLSTVVKADCICVLDNGTVSESGTHRDLLEKRGRYYNLWSTQLHQDEHILIDS